MICIVNIQRKQHNNSETAGGPGGSGLSVIPFIRHLVIKLTKFRLLLLRNY